MESILLGSLAVAGYNLSKKDKKGKKNKKYNPNTLDSTYNSNMVNKMNNLERVQASNLVSSIKNRKPEYFSQFDELTFDSASTPVGINEAHQSNAGINLHLQKMLNFNNGYSTVQDDLDYNVVTKEEFTHKNMAPNTAKRDYNIDDSRASRKLEAFTGVNEHFVPKQEKYPLFEPMKNLTYVNGMPVFTDYLDDRYLATSKNNNGNLPFTNNVVVRPGIGNQNREGLGTVYRVNPRSTDALRGDYNPKISYANKPLEVLKKGDFRGPDFNLTKYKLPDFREQTVDDLVAGRSDKWGSYKAGVFTNVSAQRGEAETLYGGHANNPNMGDGPAVSKTNFEPSNRQELYNDPTHNVYGVDIKPIFTNIESFTNRENQRATANYSDVFGARGEVNTSSLLYTDNARRTIRQTTNYDDVLGARGEFNSGNTQFTDNARRTIRETTNNDEVLGARGEFNSGNTQFTDNARRTIRETTNNDEVLGARGEFNSGNTQFTDAAKRTIRETTNNDEVLGARGEFNSGNTQFTDAAKRTIRETTNNDEILGARGEFNSGNTQYTDKAKRTIRETTNNDEVLGARGEFNSGNIQFTDNAKRTIRETTNNDEILGARGEFNSGNTQFTDNAKRTIRETMNNIDVLGARGEFNSGNTQYTDNAKITIRESTLYSTPGMNAASNVVTGNIQFSDIAKRTIKESTSVQTPGANAVSDVQSGYTRDDSDEARRTIRQTTEHTDYHGHAAGTDNYVGYARDAKDKAKTTVRQTTLLTNYTGGLSSNVEYPVSHGDAENMTIRETREILTYNRPAPGTKSLAGPQLNSKTVKMNCKKDSVYYVSHPARGLDNNIMPSNVEPYHKHTFINKKPQLDYGNYYTNNIFIDKLKENPFVNDIFHQKNVKYDDYGLSK